MRFAAYAALAVLAGCSDVPPTVTAQNGRVWEHRCPPAGTVVRTSNNTTITYGAPIGPGMCRLRDGRAMVAGLWPVPSGQTTTEAQAWLAPLFPAAAGRTSTMGSVGNAYRTRNSFLYIFEATVLGFETLALPAGRFDTVLIEWTESGTANNVHRSRHRRWLDTRTGALVQSERRVIAGIGPEHAWQAVSVSSPQRDPTVMPNVQAPRALPVDPRPLPQKPS